MRVRSAQFSQDLTIPNDLADVRLTEEGEVSWRGATEPVAKTPPAKGGDLGCYETTHVGVRRQGETASAGAERENDEVTWLRAENEILR